MVVGQLLRPRRWRSSISMGRLWTRARWVVTNFKRLDSTDSRRASRCSSRPTRCSCSCSSSSSRCTEDKEGVVGIPTIKATSLWCCLSNHSIIMTSRIDQSLQSASAGQIPCKTTSSIINSSSLYIRKVDIRIWTSTLVPRTKWQRIAW